MQLHELAFIPWSWPKQDVMLQVYFNTMLGLPQNMFPYINYRRTVLGSQIMANIYIQ